MATEQHSQPSDHDLIATLLEDRPVTYKPIVAKALKHTEVARKMRHVTAATVFLSNIMYWSSKKESKQVGGWAYRKAYEIEEETGLSRYEQEKARLLLVESGVMEEATRGVPPIKHYRVLYDGLLPLLRQQLAREMGYEDGQQEQKIPANPNLLDSLSNKNETHDSQINSGDSLSNKNETQARKSYIDKAGKKANKEVDNQSVDTRPSEKRSPENGEAGPTDRPTDGQTEENSSSKNVEASKTAMLPKPEETHHGQSNAPDLLPKKEKDNASLKPEEALRQQAEAISLSEVSEDAMRLVRKVVEGFPSLEERDYRRVKRLAEHYQRRNRAAVFSGAASGLILEAEQKKIRFPYSYLLACCVDMEKEFSEGDEAPLRSLSGEDNSSPPEESRSTGYEWFCDSGSPETGESADEQRPHTPEPDPEAERIWEKVLEDVSGEINAPSLRVWFEGTVPISLSEEALTISVPNSFAKDYIESRFLEKLEGALAKRLSPTSDGSPELEIVVEAGSARSTDNTDRRRDA